MLFSVSGNFVDIDAEKIYPAKVNIVDGKISSVESIRAPVPDRFIIPGFIDAHVHIESSMLVPSEFARLAVVHGTVATVSDPHEIANVCGIRGIEFMIENGKDVPFKFCFGAPSCVPATSFETSGYSIDSTDIENLLTNENIGYLTEVMNYPGVLAADPDLMKKLGYAQRLDKPIDGHAPGLAGEDLLQYAAAGITTDHECSSQKEGLEKLRAGIKVQIREGSAAKNFEALIGLLDEHSEMMMFCSDDKHPDNLVEGHINKLCARAVAKGLDLFKILRAACINPVKHYNLNVGLLRQGDPADFIVLNDLKSFEVLETYIDGELVASGGKTRIPHIPFRGRPINNFNCSGKTEADFGLRQPEYPADEEGFVPVIEVSDGQLVTRRTMFRPGIQNGNLLGDTQADILKMAVVNRYFDAPVAKAFVKNFGLKSGAIASSVAHDSHNIIVVGADDESMARAVNLLIESKGGISLADKEDRLLALPVAGLMSAEDGYEVAAKYSEMDSAAKELGSSLSSPYMTLSFMALLVIPEMKLSDKGLFDGRQFRLINPEIPGAV